MERTLVIIKPDAMMRGLAGEIVSRFERKGLRLIGCKLQQLSDEILAEHYSHLADKPFFPRIRAFMQSAPVLVQCWEGREAVQVIRDLCGPTNGRSAAAGTIRGDLSMSVQCNLVHASDGLEAAGYEVTRFFEPQELASSADPLESYRYALDELT